MTGVLLFLILVTEIPDRIYILKARLGKTDNTQPSVDITLSWISVTGISKLCLPVQW
jgi:hypothetical protein